MGRFETKPAAGAADDQSRAEHRRKQFKLIR